jgi:predicted small secreted protein
VKNRPIRAALLVAALALAACTTGRGASPGVSVPATLSSAAASGLEAFCAFPLATDTQVKAAVDAATQAAAGSQVDSATVGPQVDAAVTALQGVSVTGQPASARDLLVTALLAFKASPARTTASAVVSAHAAAVTAQDQACP